MTWRLSKFGLDLNSVARKHALMLQLFHLSPLLWQIKLLPKYLLHLDHSQRLLLSCIWKTTTNSWSVLMRTAGYRRRNERLILRQKVVCWTFEGHWKLFFLLRLLFSNLIFGRIISQRNGVLVQIFVYWGSYQIECAALWLLSISLSSHLLRHCEGRGLRSLFVIHTNLVFWRGQVQLKFGLSYDCRWTFVQINL